MAVKRCACGKVVKKCKTCSTCRSRKCRERNPMKLSFYNLRSNAKRRKKYFDLTFEDFKEFCYETNYMAGKGRTATSYSVDCIIDELGYTRGNLQKLSVSDNSKKWHKKVEFDWEHKGDFTTTKVLIEQTHNNPF